MSHSQLLVLFLLTVIELLDLWLKRNIINLILVLTISEVHV